MLPVDRLSQKVLKWYVSDFPSGEARGWERLRSSQQMLLFDFAVRCVTVWCPGGESRAAPGESFWGGSLVGGIPVELRLEGFPSALPVGLHHTCLPWRRRVSEPTAFWAIGHLFPLWVCFSLCYLVLTLKPLRRLPVSTLKSLDMKTAYFYILHKI